MKSLKLFSLKLILILSLGLNSSCSWASVRTDKSFFIGCTPGDELIKSQLGIPTQTKIDFIKWDLTLDKSNTFVLNIKFGESQPNTLGFIDGGQNKDFQGTYTISKNKNNEFYHLEAHQCKLTMVKLNDNLLHFLTPQNNLMVGNGGWSYTLNNKKTTKSAITLPTLGASDTKLNDNAIQVIYVGRTPCQDFASEYQLNVIQSCFKLKWKLILNKDPKTLQPTTYVLRRTNSRERDITGNWTIIKGTELNPDAIIYQLDPDKPDQTISLLVADENILFFLHKDKNMFVGNENFSYTLNKKND